MQKNWWTDLNDLCMKFLLKELPFRGTVIAPALELFVALIF